VLLKNAARRGGTGDCPKVKNPKKKPAGALKLTNEKKEFKLIASATSKGKPPSRGAWVDQSGSGVWGNHTNGAAALE